MKRKFANLFKKCNNISLETLKRHTEELKKKLLQKRIKQIIFYNNNLRSI